MSRVLSLLYILCTSLLFIYSYGYLDFNLTLSSHPLFLRFVGPLQQLVYFDRPLSAPVFVALFSVLFLLYRFVLRYTRFPTRLFAVVALILTLSYPMLSYDIFNYMFHSKILWFYHGNPHTIAPLAYDGDLWLRFMRWVHTPSAYGPVFTIIESPAYLLGFGRFVPILYLMKATMVAFFVWCVYLVGRIAKELKYGAFDIVRIQLLLAFNPFLWLELVVNSHNDAVMIALMLNALLLSLTHKRVLSFISLALSIGVKYVTALTLPALFIKNARLKVTATALLLLLPVLLSPDRFQPWYLTWSLIPAVLINTDWSRLWVALASLSGLIFYIPYIRTGFWNNDPLFVFLILYVPVLTSGSIWAIKKLWMKTK